MLNILFDVFAWACIIVLGLVIFLFSLVIGFMVFAAYHEEILNYYNSIAPYLETITIYLFMCRDNIKIYLSPIAQTISEYLSPFANTNPRIYRLSLNAYPYQKLLRRCGTSKPSLYRYFIFKTIVASWLGGYCLSAPDPMTSGWTILCLLILLLF